MGVTGIKKSATFYFFEGKPVVSTYPGEESPAVVERHFICHSGRDDGHSRLAGTGFHGTGCLGNEAAKQRSRVHLRVRLHISLFCYLTRQTIGLCPFCPTGEFRFANRNGLRRLQVCQSWLKLLDGKGTKVWSSV